MEFGCSSCCPEEGAYVKWVVEATIVSAESRVVPDGGVLAAIMSAEGCVVPDGGVMAHHAKKVGGEVDLFAKIRDKMANAAKGEGQSQAPNLAGPVMDTYRPPVAKRPAPSKVLGRIAKIQMRKGLELKLSDDEVAFVESVDPGLTMRAMSEYLARDMVLSWRVATMLQEELAAGDKKKLAEEVAALKVQRDREQVAWADEKTKLEAEVKRLKGSVVGLEKKLKAKQVELDGVNVAKDAAAEEVASEVFGLQQAVYNEHVNGFQKALSRLKAEQEVATIANEDTVVATPPAMIDGVAGEGEDADEDADGAEEAVVGEEVNDAEE
ncbi:hypothetical protein DEO72_LG4g236 [Vigna unguiculata]|uniref:Uncharacterized protein n=1 Tax=Vigna unguiculata TaxID=3917 RepID=A0A4D6LKM1_VIGUN|nr:hypothetical protein DEO72_LG4g236 [Vigna unguiculata]